MRMCLIEIEKCISAYVAGCSCAWRMLDKFIFKIVDGYGKRLSNLGFVGIYGGTYIKILGAMVFICRDDVGKESCFGMMSR